MGLINFENSSQSSGLLGNLDAHTKAYDEYRKKQKQRKNSLVSGAVDSARLAQLPTITQRAPRTGILGKFADVVDALAGGAAQTFEKSANTVGAGFSALMGLLDSPDQRAGYIKDVQKQLDPGKGSLGGVGGYGNFEQASSFGGGLSGLKQNFVKPVAAGVADIAPYVIPAGKLGEGGSLARKAVLGGLENAGISGATDAANQLLDTGKINAKQTAEQAALGFGIGAAVPTIGEGFKRLTGSSGAVIDEAATKVSGTKFDEMGVRVKDTTFAKGVDAGIADSLQKINDAGYKTTQSMSGLKADYAGKARGRYSPNGYMSFDPTSLSVEQVANIRRAAQESGLDFRTQDIFGIQSPTVRTGVTKDGTAVADILEEANKLVDFETNISKDLSGTLTRRDAIVKKLTAEHGGYISDSEIAKRWQGFANDLSPSAPKTPSITTQAAKDVKGGVTLNSGINPNLDTFISHDVSPKVKEALDTGKSLYKEVKAGFVPASVGQNAQDTAQIVRKFKANTANSAAVEATRGKEAFKAFNRAGDDRNIANISHYEKTGEFANEPVKGYSKIYKDTTDHAYKLNEQTFGKSKLGYIDNYVRRNFVFKSEGEAQAAVSILANNSRSLRPSTGNILKSRKLDIPLDEALASLKERGINAKLVTTNPELLRQGVMNSAIQAAGFKAMGEDLTSQGLIKFVGAGKQIPEGMVRLEDKAFQTYFPSKVGLVKAGEYYASESTARILNNAVSPGLEKYAAYRTIRNIKNNLNLVQLGLSAFHAGTTTINASLNDLALGLGDIERGKVVRGGGELARGLVPTASVIRQTYLGSKAFKEFASQSPKAAKVLQEAINPSGFRLRLDRKYKTSVSENLVKAFANGNFIGGTLRAPGALIEQSTRPIMEHLVPNAKLGAMLDRVTSIQATHPGATEKELATLFSKASDSIDNTYGQLVYDNLFWNKTLKDMAMVSQRSVGWNLGTIREIGGGVKDVGQLFKGKGVSDRTLYTASLPMLVGAYGAVYQYLHTGHGPTELKDYFFPKTGQTDKNGNAERISFPSYMKDVFAYTKDPIATAGHKLAPEISIAKELLTNKNYYGDLIRNPDDSIGKQFEQAGAYVLKDLSPFAVTQAQKRSKEGASKGQQFESFFGLTNAPSYITKTGFENSVSNALDKLPHAPRTPEQAALDSAKVKEGSTIERSFKYLTNVNRMAAADALSKAKPEEIMKLSPDFRSNLIDMLTKTATNPRKGTKKTTIQASKKLLAILEKYE